MGSKVGGGSRVTKQLCSCPVMTGNVPTENTQSRTWCSVNQLAYSTLPSDKQADRQWVTWQRVSSEALGWVNAPSSSTAVRGHTETTSAHPPDARSGLSLWLYYKAPHVLPVLRSTGKKLKYQENRPDYSAATKEKLRFILGWRLLLGLHKAPGRTSAYQKPVGRYQQALLSSLVVFSKQNIKINICKLFKTSCPEEAVTRAIESKRHGAAQEASDPLHETLSASAVTIDDTERLAQINLWDTSLTTERPPMSSSQTKNSE